MIFRCTAEKLVLKYNPQRAIGRATAVTSARCGDRLGDWVGYVSTKEDGDDNDGAGELEFYDDEKGPGMSPQAYNELVEVAYMCRVERAGRTQT